MRLIVTGASGLLGANFILTAQECISSCEITAISARTATRFPGADNLLLDLGDIGAIRSLIRSMQPHWIVHFAAHTDVDWCENHPLPAKRLHVDASEELARLAQETGARFLYMSSDSVFDGSRDFYLEQDRPAPCNVYAASKLAGELSCARCNPLSLIVRSNFYGWNLQHKNSLAEWILACLQKNRPIPGFTDIVFSPLLVNDLCLALLQLMERKATGLVHLASADSCSKYQFARKVARTFGYDPGLVMPALSDQGGFTARRPKKTVLVSGRPDTPTTGPIEDGLLRMRELQDRDYPDNLKNCLQETANEPAYNTAC